MNEAATAIHVTILCFASVRERLGGLDSILWEGPAGSRVGDLRAALARCYPAIAPLLGSCRMAMNQEFVGDEGELQDGAEIAVIPPVSGG